MEPHLLAGVGKADITAEPGAVIGDLLTEQAKPHIPRELWDKVIEVDDPLLAKALVLDNGSTRLALITMDVTAVGCRTTSQNILDDSADDFIPSLSERLQAELDIPPENVAVCASHTHPPGRTLCDDEEQLRRTFTAVQEAVQNLTPVVLGVGATQEERLSINRTIRTKNGRHKSGPWPDDEIESLGPVDTEVGVVRIDRLDGTPLAVVYDFSSHILMNSPNDNLSAGFPGVTSGFLEKNLGHGALAFFLQGAFGDVMEIACQYTERTNPRTTSETGLMLAQSVLDAYQDIQPASGNFQVVSRTIELPLRRDIPKVVVALSQQQTEWAASLDHVNLDFKSFLLLYLQYHLFPEFPARPAMRYLRAAETGDPLPASVDRRNRLAMERYLGNLRLMENMARNEFDMRTLRKHQEIVETLGGDTVPAQIQGLKIGEAVFITAPMEILTEVGFHVKEMSPFAHTYLISNVNGYYHYSPPASYYSLGSYEATECLLAPEWEEIFYQTVQDIFAQLQSLE